MKTTTKNWLFSSLILHLVMASVLITAPNTASAKAFTGEVYYLDTGIANSSKIAESEYANTYVVDTARLGLKVNYKLFHVGLEKEKIRADQNFDKADTLINNDRLWLGLGIHTNKNTNVTYWDDLNSDFWKLTVESKTEIRPRLHLLGKIYHLDHQGGTLSKSGGRRTTGLGVGLEYDLCRYASIKAMMEINNNGAANVEDRLLSGLVIKF